MNEQTSYVNYGSFENWASTLDKQNNSLRQTLEDVKTRINSLQGDYESDSATTIQEKINGMTPRFDQYEQVVKQYTTFLRNTASGASSTVAAVDSDAQKFI